MRYSKDPFWMTARFSSPCGNPDCHYQIRKGENIFYFPLGKKAYCQHCGNARERQFQAEIFDESVYSA